MAVALGVFAFLSAEAFGVDSVFMDGKGMSAVAAAARDPLSLIALRSPGGRAGLLQQTKPGRKPPPLADRGLKKPPPPAEGLTETPTGEGLPPPAPVFAIREVIPPPPGPPDTPAPAFPVELAPPTPGPEDTPGVGGPFVEVPGGGSGFTPPTGAIPIVETPGGPGVPEPSVWATLIVGFFGIGAALRARRRGAVSVKRARLDVGA